MTNKELFKKLSEEQQMEIVKTLASYDKVHVEVFNGEYYITPNWILSDKYRKILNEFNKDEFDFENHNYELEWYYFWNDKERKGEKNVKGTWQKEFEELWKSIYKRVIKKYLEA